ncbi:CarboxypepD_reg-like domain-containing protein [Porphyromonadaceae bacterium NLAE-zl-C104]|nr:CarboxypepD_reg-like domain-containing protein [Porphyromonadaceae bacterium NLAE-zl-C104]
MKKISILFFLFLISAGVSVFGQNTLLKGVVTDAKYHTPVPYAALFIQGTSIGTVADNTGEFSLSVPDSITDRRLMVAREGFQLMSLSLDEHETERLIVALEPDDYVDRVRAIQDSIAVNSGAFGAFLARAVKFVTNDWIPLGDPETNRFDFGRIQTIPTYNPIEGIRLRAGIASNSRLSPHFFVKGYLAYGFRDQQLKYRGEAIYSFNKKAYHEDEFPKNNLRLVYENDLYSPGDMHPYALNDLLLITYRRSKNEATYRNFAELNYEREYKNGLAHTFRVRRSRLVPQGKLQFDQDFEEGKVLTRGELNTTDVGVLLRYSVREAYHQQKRKRIPLEITSPVFFLSHMIGVDGFMGGEVAYHRTEFSAQKRFLLGYAGRLDVVGEVMKIWDKVPFPLLIYPNQRYRYHIENNFFFLNRPLEFVADEQYTLRMTFVGDDLLLAKMPVADMLQLRELASLRVAHGRLSDKNNPAVSPSGLYHFPSVSHRYDNVPYVEGTIGITNILGLLRVEYVHRFTYRDHPDALLGAFRVDVTL